MCYFNLYTMYYFFTSSSFLISLMTASKLLIVKFPIRASAFRLMHAHVCCSIIWAFVVALPLTIFIVGGVDISCSSKLYIFELNITKGGWGTWKWLEPLVAVVFLLIPNLVVLVSTVLLIKEAINIIRRSPVRTPLKWQGITTTILIASVYCISILPFFIYRIFAAYVPDTPGNIFHHEFWIFAKFIIYLNTACNFYIYCLTVYSFREFLLKKLNLHRPNPTITPRRG